MKINLSIVLLSLLLNVSAYAETLKVSEVSDSDTNVSNIMTPEKVTNEWLKNKTVTDLRKLEFLFKTEFLSANNAQFLLYKTFKNPFSIVYVICFIDPIKTICRIA